MWRDTERCYRAVMSRDARFDGQFILAVRTTGIYCRPSCPAMTPKERNVQFFPTSAAAQANGYRACRRCLPDAVPGSPDWNVRADLAARAMRLIAEGVVEREGVTGLANRLGYSERQLGRVLSAELGAGPLALARAHRAHSARLLIELSELPLTDVAFAAGFASVRQFNNTIREVFGTTPSQLRVTAAGKRGRPAPAPRADGAGVQSHANDTALISEGSAPTAAEDTTSASPASSIAASPARASSAVSSDGTSSRSVSSGASADASYFGTASSAAASSRTGATAAPAAVVPAGVSPVAPASAGTLLDLRLPVREPFDADGLFSFLAARAVPGVEVADHELGTFWRTLRLPHGSGVVRLTPSNGHVRCELRLTDVRDLGTAVARVRRMLDLDADPAAVRSVLETDPAVAPLVAATPGIRVPGAIDGPELLIRAMLGQQVSVAAARTAAGALAAAIGERTLAAVDGEPDVLFPTPAAIAEHGPRLLRGPRRRMAAIVGAAEAMATGTLDVHVGRDADDLRAELLDTPGIGPWTADYVLMRLLGNPDVLMADDLVVRKGAVALGVDGSDLAGHAERWRPWRSYASMYLWRAGGTSPAPPQRTATVTARGESKAATTSSDRH
ncbi:Methylphosphotriester-DNA--protein-cysteine methyltransferase (N-terminal fragment of Ada), contains Zn-binding and two AraC-type DNA-binding domains [Prauserella marina]|uniref:DNA-3-methyladenine glycosylase II n=2 Tax=Prauserella marina TaxID=530584 RepID=A0A1G6WX40_9PSEU|nr:DNA-3-methyladenine glycosylase II [Prauserella marina]SDD69575.1 Methylphosphotriester-DNA--protein-cysteine methyltransferase (N-terminal fragment of Ada), contains Zn-binding and two AraC-type DNA-binding domains [Prauserella marina]